MPRKRREADTVQISVRTKEPLRLQLEAAAKTRGVSMNTEIVDRLQRSFENDRRLEEIFGSREVYGVMRIIAAAIHETGLSAGFYSTSSIEGAKGWLRNPWAYDQAVQAATRVLEVLRPAGDVMPPEEQEHMRNLGRGFANGILNEIARGEARVPTNSARTDELRRELGPLAERLTESETMKEDLKFNIQRDDNQQVTVTLTNKKPQGKII
jgi:hypothetical protein